VVELALEIRLDGLVASNTTIERGGLHTPFPQLQAIGAGGLSGKPLTERSTDLVRYIHQKTGSALPLIASGGIFTARDVRQKCSAGASLLEIWTGFIYEGPFIVKKISKDLRLSK
jgi:dihydroorotate dehydrogenase